MAKGKKPTPQEIYWERKRKEEREKAALLPAGFVNHGNTCFMNSVLQGLVATHLLEDLIRFRLPESLQLLASRRSPLLTNGRGPEGLQRDWVQGLTLGDAFVHILERSWRVRDAKDRSSMSPRELLSRLGAKYDQYLDFRQQDAHEFLLHLLDGMRMEEFDIIKQRQPRPPHKSKSRSNAPNGTHYTDAEPIPEQERLTSFVDMAFGGKLASVLICGTCNHISHTYEDFDDLSLSITHDESKERMRDRLRTFASKFKSSSHRSRDQTTARPMSFSQPPSPPLPPTTLDIPEDAQEAPRRRSLEAPSSPIPTHEIPKIDLLAGFAGDTISVTTGEVPTHQPRPRSHRVSEVGLGKLGKKLSVGMALAGKKDKKPRKVELETRMAPSEEAITGVMVSGVDVEKPRASAPTSRPPSRQLSPTPFKKPQKEKKSRKPSEHDRQKSVYLQRLLEDSTTTLSNPLAVLRAATPLGPGTSSQWSKLGAVQGIEDCLRMFTAVEVLDGENMVGCRNCWKIANGQRPVRHNTQSDADSVSSEEDEERHREDQPSRPEIVDPHHSFSMPNLPPGKDATLSSLPPSTRSTPPLAPSNPSISEAEATELESLSLTERTASISTPPSFDAHNSQASKTVPHLRNLSTVDTSFPRHFTSEPVLQGLPVPTITAISPPPEISTFDLPSTSNGLANEKETQQHHSQNVKFSRQLGGYAASSRDSLRLPNPQSHRRRDTSRGGESSLSSEESEYDETSGISDGDVSVSSVPNSMEPRRPPLPGVPRSKQVVYRRALKRYLIARPSPILAIHFKRFQQVSKSPVTLFGNLKKLDEYVSFPEYLDIRPFLAPMKEDYGLGRGEMRGKVIEKGKRAEDQPCVYRLYAVVVHIGNMLGGHYIAYTALPSTSESSLEYRERYDNLSNGRAPIGPSPGKVESTRPASKERQWCYISDTVVRLASLEEVLKSKAYICMYERVR